MKLYNEDMQVALNGMLDNSVDSIITDPPYGINFMKKQWDYDVPSVDMWKQCLRVLKPGGHLLSFSSPRTYHRMVINIEDAGFEVRDQIMWAYNSGFPKSHNISKVIDSKGGNNIFAAQFASELKQARLEAGESKRSIESRLFTYHGNWDWWEGRNYKGKACPKLPKYEDIKTLAIEFPVLHHWLSKLKPAKREVIGQHNGNDAGGLGGERLTTLNQDITVSATDLAKKWDGWGTALKPAHEPIVVCRKPLSETTVAANVVKWGTGGLNIDQSRIPFEDGEVVVYHSVGEVGNFAGRVGKETTSDKDYHSRTDGRWPANLIHDGLWNDKDHGKFYFVPKVSKRERNEGLNDFTEGFYSNDGRHTTNDTAYQRGHAVGKNTHPTVKPITLMHYLIRMVTYVDGTVLDPFMGSGSTGCAAVANGYNFIGIEMEESSYKIARTRINYFKK